MSNITTPTSRAQDDFTRAIKDAENLLAHFNTLKALSPSADIEVLKRAGLIVAMTAWETYVEDRVREAVDARLASVADGTISAFIRSRLGEEIKRLHNPNADKTLKLFRDYVGIELADRWTWNNFETEKVRERLDEYLKLRGDVVHRARVIKPGPPSADPVTKGELQKAIAFLKNLVAVTEAALAPSPK